MGETIFGIFMVAFMLFAIISAFKESKTTGLYRAFGVYGRLWAYLTMDFIFAGLFVAIGSIAALFIGEEGEKLEIGAALAGAGVGVLIFLLGLLMYGRSKKKCPEFLRRKLFISMLITMMGVSFKIALFFIGAVWKLTAPKEVEDSHGNTLYVYGGEVYTTGGEHVGTSQGDGTFIPNENYIH